MAKPPPQPIQIANKILRNFFQPDRSFHHPMLQENKDGIWGLRQEKLAIRTTDGKDRIFVAWPINLGTSFQFNYFLSFTISLFANESIKDLNIKLFRESTEVSEYIDSAIIPTELLLRAEWSNEKAAKDATFIHAQPHWHVHAAKVFDLIGNRPIEVQRAFLELLREEEKEDNPVSQFMAESNEVEMKAEQSDDTPMFRFHLAMAADWCSEKKAVRERDLDEKTLQIWLPQCLEYIREQVEYIMGKMRQSKTMK